MAAALAADGSRSSQAEQSKRALNTYVKQSLTSNGTQEYYARYDMSPAVCPWTQHLYNNPGC